MFSTASDNSLMYPTDAPVVPELVVVAKSLVAPMQ